MPVRFRPGAPYPAMPDMLTVQGCSPVARRSPRACAASASKRSPGSCVLLTGQERRGQDHAAARHRRLARSRRKGRCLAWRAARAATRNEFHAELAYLGHEPPLKGDLSAPREPAAIPSAFAAPSPRPKSTPRSRAPAPRRSPIARDRACCRPASSGRVRAGRRVARERRVVASRRADHQSLMPTGNSSWRELDQPNSWRATGLVVAAVHHSLPLPADQLVAARARASMKTTARSVAARLVAAA